MGANLNLCNHLGSSEREKLGYGGANPFYFHGEHSQMHRHQYFISCLHTIATHSFPLSIQTLPSLFPHSEQVPKSK